MYLTVLTYRITGMEASDWDHTCDGLAPVFAAVPGLVSKTWLRGPDATFGGVYLWKDHQAFLDFIASDLGAAMSSHPSIADLHIAEYDVDEAHSRVTHGLPVPA
jgi:Putative mono-oxygenase ydhR